MQQDKISIDLKLPTKWEDLSDKQLRYVFALLAQGYTATEVKAYCLHRWAGLKVLHRYGNVWACKHDSLQFILAAEQVERATHALCNRQRVAGKHAQHPVAVRHRGLHAKA